MEEEDDILLDDLITKFQNSSWLANDEVPILFMEDKDLPANWEDHPDLAAIARIDYEGTPEEIAENYRDKGNEYFNKGKYQEAIACYTKSIQQRISDKKANSVYYANRAAVNLHLGNSGRVIQDAMQAILYDPDNIKAYYRAAKAATALEKYKQAIQFCEQGLLISTHTNIASAHSIPQTPRTS